VGPPWLPAAHRLFGQHGVHLERGEWRVHAQVSLSVGLSQGAVQPAQLQ